MPVRSFSADKYHAELLLQNNGPGTVQRVLKVYPEAESPVPAVVVPFYFPEAMLGFELDSGEPLPGYAGIDFIHQLVERGFACICADAYHLTYVESDRARDDFRRWQEAADKLNADWPEWCGVGKLVSDTRLLLDLLCEDEKIDSSRIAIAGHSLGGKMAFYTGFLDTRIKAVIASDFGLPWDSTNWDRAWYWGEKLSLFLDAGLTNADFICECGAKPFFLIAGEADTEASSGMVLSTGLYGNDGDPDFQFINHATGHRPPQWTLDLAWDWLQKVL